MTDRNKQDLRHWRIRESVELIARPPWLTLLEQSVELPDGRVIAPYYQLRLPDFATVLPFTEGGRAVLLRQYKHGPRRVSLTLPGGIIEADEEPQNAAQRELYEETGYLAREWTFLGTFIANGNLGGGRGHFFRANGARRVAEPQSGDLEEMEVVLLDVKELRAALFDGRVQVMSSAAGIAMAMLNGLS